MMQMGPMHDVDESLVDEALFQIFKAQVCFFLIYFDEMIMCLFYDYS